jgi:hypothetical protein
MKVDIRMQLPPVVLRTGANPLRIALVTPGITQPLSLRIQYFFEGLPRFPLFETLLQRSNIDFGKDRRLDTFSMDKPSSVTTFTASSRNSFV